MNIEDEFKHKVYSVDFFANKVVRDLSILREYSGQLVEQVDQIQREMEMLREQNKKLTEALGRIGTQALIVKQTGTIFMDKEETITLHKYVSDILTECRL